MLFRSVAVKDLDPAGQPDFAIRTEDGKRYDPRVLLDMDYWELVPRRGR